VKVCGKVVAVIPFKDENSLKRVLAVKERLRKTLNLH
jgi:hypothetical protein